MAYILSTADKKSPQYQKAYIAFLDNPERGSNFRESIKNLRVTTLQELLDELDSKQQATS
jgi:hypothetical protein